MDHIVTVRWELVDGGGLVCLAISPDDNTLAAGYLDGSVHLVHLFWIEMGVSFTLEERIDPNIDEYPEFLSWCVAFSQDGGSLAFSAENSIQHWNVSECTWYSNSIPTRKHTFVGHAYDMLSVVFTSSTQMVSGSSDEMRVWDLTSGACTQVLKDHTGSVLGMSLSADGFVLISASADGTLKRWGLRRGGTDWECTMTLRGHTDSVRCVAVSAAGDMAVSGSEDNSLRVWCLKTGACKKVLEGHTDHVYVVALSGDCKITISGGSGHTVYLWQMCD